MSSRSSSQSWDPEVYRRNARYVSDLATAVLALLNPRTGERILDLGCGDGVIALHLADLGCSVIGVDASPELVAAARAAGVEAYVRDARHLDFNQEFDKVFSNAVLHWIKEADEVLAGVHGALRSGGSFAAELGGHRCVENIHQALIAELDRRGHDGAAASPWYFPTPEDYGERLSRAGFTVEHIELVPRPTPLPAGLRGFIETFGGSFVKVLPEPEREAYVSDVCQRLEGVLRSSDGTWIADYTRLRFVALR